MTQAEKMVWAAAFALNLEKQKGNPHQAERAAQDATSAVNALSYARQQDIEMTREFCDDE